MIEWYDVYNIKECTYSFVYIHIPIFVMFKTLFTEHIFNSKKLYIDNVETKVLLILLKKKSCISILLHSNYKQNVP